VILILLASLVLIGIAVTLVVRAGTAPRARTAENLGQIDRYGFSSSTSEPLRPGRLSEGIDSLAGLFGGWVAGSLRRGDEQELRIRLVAAGLYTWTPRKFSGYRVLSALLGLALWGWLAGTGALSPAFAVLFFLLMVLGGWMAPLWLVNSRAQRRLARIDYDLPELIDLLVVTVEAGVGFTASLQIAVERLPGPLGDELRLALQEQAMGLSTNEALQNMLARCDTPAVRSFVRSVLQGETLGVSIGQIMRSLATEMRKRRRATAEERAQKAPIKILFPLVFLIFPAMFIVLLGPAVYSFIQAFGD
jgi:tight adherence protein C